MSGMLYSSNSSSASDPLERHTTTTTLSRLFVPFNAIFQPCHGMDIEKHPLQPPIVPKRRDWKRPASFAALSLLSLGVIARLHQACTAETSSDRTDLSPIDQRPAQLPWSYALYAWPNCTDAIGVPVVNTVVPSECHNVGTYIKGASMGMNWGNRKLCLYREIGCLPTASSAQFDGPKTCWGFFEQGFLSAQVRPAVVGCNVPLDES